MAIDKSKLGTLKLPSSFQQLFGNSTMAIAISCLSTGKFIEANKAFTELYGYSLDEVIGHTSEEFNLWNDPEERKRIIQQLNLEGCVHNFPVEYRHKSGAIGHALASISIIDIEGIQHLIGFISKEKDLDETQLALLNKEVEFHSLFKNMLNGFAYCRMLIEEGQPKDFVYLSVNQAFEEITGLKDVIGKKVSELLPDVLESSSELINTYAEVAMTGTPERIDTYIPTLDKWLIISVYSPKHGYFVAVFDDVTALHRAKEAELSISQEKFQLIFDNMQEGVAHCRMIYEDGKPADFEYLAVNSAFERITGMKGVVGRQINSIIPNYSINNPESIKMFGSVASDGVARNWEHYLQEIDRYLSFSIYSPKLGEFIVVSSDITERKKAEASLRESNYILTESQRIAHVGSWHYYLSPEQVIWSEETYRIFGVNPKTFTPSVESLLNVIHQDDKMSMQMWISNCAQGKKPEVLEFRIVLSDGSIRILSGYGEVIYDTDNKPSHLLGMVHDITDRKLAEESLRKSQLQSKVFVQDAPISIAMFDKDMNYLATSDRWVVEYGRGYTNLVGRNHYEIHPDVPEDWKIAHQRGLHGETIKNADDKWIQTDGSEHWLRWAIVPWTDEVGNIGGIIISAEDITEIKHTEEKLRLWGDAFEKVEFGLAMADPITNTFISVNPTFAKERGYSREELIGKPLMTVFPVAVQGQFKSMISKLDAASHIVYESIHLCKDGRQFPVLLDITTIKSAEGVPLRRIAYVMDITDRKFAERELRVAATAFEAQEGMLVTDASSVILRVNAAFTSITGYTAEEVIGKTPNILSSGRHDAAFYKAMWESINSTGSWEGEIWNKRKNYEVYPEQLIITAVKNKDGDITNYVATLTDITMSKKAADEIKNLAFYDPLTQLPNRRLLQDRLFQALSASDRNGQTGAMLFIDLDNFKIINDTLGHTRGDLLLQKVAERLKSCVREGDTVSRLGGDEFVLILEDLSKEPLESAGQAEAVAEKILITLNQPYHLGKQEHFNTPSIGITLFTGHETSPDDLLKQSDIAMYQAKDAGRNTIRFFDPKMQDAINARSMLESELRNAVLYHQFFLYYQIQVNHLSQPVGAEALIRWVHPQRDLVSPAEFIPVAEETGLILPIGKWVLETACAQLSAWQLEEETRDLVLSVNVSAKQFRQANFVKEVKEIVMRYGINPTRLKLELTESILLDNVGNIINSMNAISELGVHFSLDDFGTGYSSLQYLRQLPLHQLKIDKSFVKDLEDDSNDRAIVHTIIAMAQSLNLEVIAEGVETDMQRQYLEDAGCNHYQGYLFGKPIPIKEFKELLKKDGAFLKA